MNPSCLRSVRGSCVCGAAVCTCGAHCVAAGRFSSILLFTTHIGTKQPAAVAVWIFGVLDDKSSLCGFELELCGTLPASSLRVFALFCASGSVCCKMEAGWRRRRMLPWPPSSSSSSSSHNLLYTSHGDHTPQKTTYIFINNQFIDHIVDVCGLCGARSVSSSPSEPESVHPAD